MPTKGYAKPFVGISLVKTKTSLKNKSYAKKDLQKTSNCIIIIMYIKL